MAENSDIVSGLNGLLKKLDKIAADFTNQRTMNRVGLMGVRFLKDRTRKGRDVQGRPFKPYSEEHARRRAKLNLPTNVVNLEMNDIDGMMSSIDFEVSRDFSTTTFLLTKPDKEQLMNIHSFLGAGKSRVIRQVWGFSDKEHEKMIRTIADDLKKLVIKDIQS